MTKRMIHRKAQILVSKCATTMNISEQNDFLKQCTDYLESEGWWSKNRIHTELGVSTAFLKDNMRYSEHREDELLLLIGKVYTVIVENGLEI